MFKIKREPETLIPIFISIAIILFLSSIFIPFVLITIIQDIFFRPSVDIWFFNSPPSSYIILGITIVYFAIIFAVLAFIQYRVEGKGKKKLLYTILAFIPGIVISILCPNQYYYFNDEGIHRNTFFSTEEISYDWDDFEKATYYLINRDYRLIIIEIELETKTGEVFSYDFDQNLLLNQARIRGALEASGVEVVQVEIVEED